MAIFNNFPDKSASENDLFRLLTVEKKEESGTQTQYENLSFKITDSTLTTGMTSLTLSSSSPMADGEYASGYISTTCSNGFFFGDTTNTSTYDVLMNEDTEGTKGSLNSSLNRTSYNSSVFLSFRNKGSEEVQRVFYIDLKSEKTFKLSTTVREEVGLETVFLPVTKELSKDGDTWVPWDSNITEEPYRYIKMTIPPAKEIRVHTFYLYDLSYEVDVTGTNNYFTLEDLGEPVEGESISVKVPDETENYNISKNFLNNIPIEGSLIKNTFVQLVYNSGKFNTLNIPNIVYGEYVGNSNVDGEYQEIKLGFNPRALLVIKATGYGPLTLLTQKHTLLLLNYGDTDNTYHWPVYRDNKTGVRVNMIEGGFRAYGGGYNHCGFNHTGITYCYFALI